MPWSALNSQRALEQALARAAEQSGLAGGAGAMPASMTLDVPALNLEVVFDGTVNLE